MAKKINILKAGNAIPFADGGLKLSKSISIDKIEEHPVFKKLYSIDEDLLNRIADDMVQNNFDGSQPLHIWHCIDDDGTEHWYLIDGYTRLMAAKIAKLEIVPYFEHNFKNFEEAHRYAVHLQVDRRNLGSYDLIKNIELLMGSDYIQNMKGKKSEAIAEVLGVSDRTVEKAIAVSEEADEETLSKVESGELSVNKAYKQTKEKARKAKADDEELSDSLSDNTGNPSGLNFNHSDGIERPNNRLSDKEDNERTRERKTAYELGYTDGFLKSARYIIDQINGGATCELLEKAFFKMKLSYENIITMTAEQEESVESEENEDSENAAEYEEIDNESSIDAETESDDEAFDLGFGEE